MKVCQGCYDLTIKDEVELETVTDKWAKDDQEAKDQHEREGEQTEGPVPGGMNRYGAEGPSQRERCDCCNKRYRAFFRCDECGGKICKKKCRRHHLASTLCENCFDQRIENELEFEAAEDDRVRDELEREQ